MDGQDDGKQGKEPNREVLGGRDARSTERVLYLVLVAFYAISIGWGEELLRSAAPLIVLGAIAWFPHETASATGRLGVGTGVSRSSNPWILFVIAWILLLFIFGLGAVLEQVGTV